MVVYVSSNVCYPSFLLLSIFSPPVNVHLKWQNPLFWAYPRTIFYRVNWWQNTLGKQWKVIRAKSISSWKVKQCKLAPTVTASRTRNFPCTNVRVKPFYMHKNQGTQILNFSSPVFKIISAGNIYLFMCPELTIFTNFNYVFIH